jgi:hypothetical protein
MNGDGKMERIKTQTFKIVFLVSLLQLASCHQNSINLFQEKPIEYRNTQMLNDFSPQEFLPKDTFLATLKDSKQNFVIGDYDGDSLGDILFAFHFKNSKPDNPTMGAILLKQEDGKWVKKYEYREKATSLYMAKACDLTGDGLDDLLLGWETDPKKKEKHIYIYRWAKKDLESIGNFFCTKLDVADFEGIFGKDGQHELGIWNQTEDTIFIDIFRWNAYTTLPLLFPTEYGKPYTQSKLSRAEDIEVVYFKNTVIPELLSLSVNFPNEATYDFALIQAYLKSLLPDLALQKIKTSENTLLQKDFEKIPYLQAQAYFLKEEITKGNQLLEKELSKPINRIDAGTTLQLLGRSYMKVKEWDKANLAFNNAQIFHKANPDSKGFDEENQFQFSLAKDKSRLEVLKHFSDLRSKMDDTNYKEIFQNHLLSDNRSKRLPIVHISEFYLSLNEFSEPFATILTWEENGKKKEILFMS